ncbi:DUF4260 family protein [Polycladomyces sp. WAk]|uniref:DUF4260 family protein n=1 Tax=Polycladomyces zharkentensis TaxID=2807616 RepID=A0ABS2WHJ6_9BACL|nr:DUF4260 family protein [Polycladomyces sp. WAk]
MYNAGHTYLLPLAIFALGHISAFPSWIIPVSLIWIAHIGMDRFFGFGLKYPEKFSNTHLHRA